jgi:hypothetical protein
LTVADALHVLTSDTVMLGGYTHNLELGDAYHAVTSDEVALIQTFVLTVADALHPHTSEGVTLAQYHLLVVADSRHAITSDNVRFRGFPSVPTGRRRGRPRGTSSGGIRTGVLGYKATRTGAQGD